MGREKSVIMEAEKNGSNDSGILFRLQPAQNDFALVVQWIELWTSKPLMGVRFPPRAPN